MKNTFLDYTLGAWLDKMADEHGDNEAMVYVDRGIRMTYRQFNETCRTAAKALWGMGVRKGDHVSVWAPNYPEWLTLVFATAKIGAVLVTVNTSYKIFEVEYLLRQSDTHTLFLAQGFKDSDYVGIINELAPEISAGGRSLGIEPDKLPRLKNVVFMQRVPSDPAPAGMTSWYGMMDLAGGVSDAELDAISAVVSPHDVTNIQYTSGTTGFPKGVMLTHYNILNNGKFIGDNMHLTPADRFVICVPFFHCFGLVLSIMACVTHASTMIPLDAFSATGVLELVSSERATALNGVPTMFIFALEHPDFKQYDVSTLRTGIMAGANCPEELMRRCAAELGMTGIVSVYGLTESSPGITMSHCTEDTLERRVTTVGRLLPGGEGKIVDPETGDETPTGVPGEIMTRGYHVMRGYYNMPEATKTAIEPDGWLHTGDIGTMDEAGFYKITGRLKDMIIRGGENISPREIEEFLYTHPKVKDVQVVGAPSKKFGEEIAAFIILKDDETCTEEEIKAFVLSKMARYKVPSYVIFTQSFPMTGSGKIQKYKLREDAVAMLGLEDGARE